MVKYLEKIDITYSLLLQLQFSTELPPIQETHYKNKRWRKFILKFNMVEFPPPKTHLFFLSKQENELYVKLSRNSIIRRENKFQKGSYSSFFFDGIRQYSARTQRALLTVVPSEVSKAKAWKWQPGEGFICRSLFGNGQGRHDVRCVYHRCQRAGPSFL